MTPRSGGGGEAAQARQEEQMRQGRIREGTGRIDDIFKQNFTDDFYGNRQQAYLDYATPQLEDQYGKAQKDLTFALARSGNLDSSVRGQRVGELERAYGARRREVADTAMNQANEARTSVEGARTNLVSMLNATGDAESASQSALTRAGALSQPAAYSPIGQLFTDFTATLGTQAALERAHAAGGRAPAYNTGLFGTPRAAVRVT